MLAKYFYFEYRIEQKKTADIHNFMMAIDIVYEKLG